MKYLSCFLFLLLLANLLPAQAEMITPASAVRVNAREQRDKPYVILISLDGYRYDYTERFQPPNISAFIREGVRATSMESCFPSKTFPNHYSIATGMYPENHGLVDNTFWDPAKGKEYRINNREVVEDGSWYGGTPIWVNAARAGMVTASFFFVGSEADVQGVRPSYYYRYDGSVPNDARVDQALEWLRLPEKKRPHLITLYFSDMDNVGHMYGPHADAKLDSTLRALDATLGRLFDGVAALDLPVNIVIVSDHGMEAVPPDHYLPQEPFLMNENFYLVNDGTLIRIYLKKEADPGTVFQKMKALEDHFTVYMAEDFPYYNTDTRTERFGDILIVPEYGYHFSDQRRIGMMKNSGVEMTGVHGYAPEVPAMHGIFYARGPGLKSGAVIPTFRNIHVYPLLCQLLGLPVPEEVDGDAAVLAPALR